MEEKVYEIILVNYDENNIPCDGISIYVTSKKNLLLLPLFKVKELCEEVQDLLEEYGREGILAVHKATIEDYEDETLIEL